MLQRWRDIRERRSLAAIFAIASLVAFSLAAGFAKAAPVAPYQNASPTTVKIAANAQFISPFQINVELMLNCTSGAGYFAFVDVVQPQGFGFTTVGNGFVSGQCTGKQQKLAVPVYPFFGTWQLGDAVASATACTMACDSDTRQIHIVL